MQLSANDIARISMDLIVLQEVEATVHKSPGNRKITAIAM